jgi:hypothetical protein
MVKKNKDEKELKEFEKVVDIQDASERLGPDLIAQIAEKEWKTAPLPSAEEIAQEKHDSPKARNNPNSRRNLIQYRNDKSVEVKEKIVSGLKFNKIREDVDPFTFINLPPEYDSKILQAFLPNRLVLKSADEEKAFYTILNSYMNDFDLAELNSSDIEDIVGLAVNRVIENRLLELSSTDPNILVDVAPTIERFRKHSDKVKGNLASRRSDRIDPKSRQNFSIVDLVCSFDDKKKNSFDNRMEELNREEDEYLLNKEKRLDGKK